MSAPDVDFAPCPESPALEADFLGVAIRVEARSAHGRLSALRLHGAYQLTVAQAAEIAAVPLQRALVVTATSGLVYASFNLAGETITFEDDEQTGGGLVRGYFNANLLRQVGVAPYGKGYVLVSLGAHLSNIETFAAV